MPSEKLSFKLEYWESQNLMFTNQPKIVIVELSDGGSDVELMKYLFAQEHKRIGRGEHHIFNNSANKTHY